MKLDNKILLFDLGGVIINIDTQLTIKAFAEIANLSEGEIIKGYKQCQEFKSFEKGELSNAEFRNFLREWLKKPILNDTVLDDAWNAMILDLPSERLQHLLKLKEQNHILLLSNTNDIHLKCVYERVQQSVGEASLDPFFHTCYYSHIIGMRKPDAEVYHHIFETHKADPSSITFFDDSVENLEGAKAVGINTVEVKDPAIIFEIETND